MAINEIYFSIAFPLFHQQYYDENRFIRALEGAPELATGDRGLGVGLWPCEFYYPEKKT